MRSTVAESDQGWRRGRFEEAPTRHLQVGGVDPWSANVNELIEEFMAAARVCYYAERNLGPDPEYCLEEIRRPEDYVVFLSALDVSPRVLTREQMEAAESGRDFEFSTGWDVLSGQTGLGYPPGLTIEADDLRLRFTLRRDRQWEFSVQNGRHLGLEGDALSEAEIATLARPKAHRARHGRVRLLDRRGAKDRRGASGHPAGGVPLPSLLQAHLPVGRWYRAGRAPDRQVRVLLWLPLR